MGSNNGDGGNEATSTELHPLTEARSHTLHHTDHCFLSVVFDDEDCVFFVLRPWARIYEMLCKKKKKKKLMSVKCAHPQMSEGVSNMGVGEGGASGRPGAVSRHGGGVAHLHSLSLLTD